jgi:hypothetical protein
MPVAGSVALALASGLLAVWHSLIGFWLAAQTANGVRSMAFVALIFEMMRNGSPGAVHQAVNTVSCLTMVHCGCAPNSVPSTV